MIAVKRQALLGCGQRRCKVSDGEVSSGELLHESDLARDFADRCREQVDGVAAISGSDGGLSLSDYAIDMVREVGGRIRFRGRLRFERIDDGAAGPFLDRETRR